jgi:hypothetical protein
MAGYQFDVSGIGFIQGSIVQHQKTAFTLYQSFGLLPQRLGVGRLSGQQTGKGIMSGGIAILRLTTRGFSTTEDLLRSDQKVNVIQFIAFGWIHLAYSFGISFGFNIKANSSTA